MTLATALLGDPNTAEDIVQDVFVAFAENINTFELNGSLKSYLSVCAVNRIRNWKKAKHQQSVDLDQAVHVASSARPPDRRVIVDEEMQQLIENLNRLPEEQKEVIFLHLNGGLKFREIARLQDVSLNTVQSRYRYGLEKLRSLYTEERIS